MKDNEISVRIYDSKERFGAKVIVVQINEMSLRDRLKVAWVSVLKGKAVFHNCYFREQAKPQEPKVLDGCQGLTSLKSSQEKT